ncbi:MAG: hypothetical protein ACQEXJ_22895 [Myxococcota bacterium]
MALEILSLLGIGFVGSVLWIVSPEVTSAVYGAKLGWHPLLVGAVVSVGQMGVYTLLYFGGEALVRRWRWLERQVQRTRDKYEKHLEQAYLTLMFVGGIFGIPPVLGMVTLGGSFGIPALHLLPVTFAGRVVRFTALAALGEPALEWWEA